MSTQRIKDSVKETMLLILNQGGDEYTRAQLAILACGSGVAPEFVKDCESLVVELDIEDKVDVRVDGSGVAYYSKAKPRSERPRVTGINAFTRRGTVRPIVESVHEGHQR